MIEIPITWLLTTVGVLGGTIATLAGIIYSSLSARIAEQGRTIEHLRGDVERLSKGCGQEGCHWRGR